jgi:GTPase SAR1 family protein
MLNITKGKIDRALKVVAYGSEGIGKTTFAATFPEPLFIDTESGTAHMDVRRINRPQSWEELLSIVNEVATDSNVCKTLVLDTADWAEALCMTHVCQKYKQNSIESFGYGKGYTYLSEEFGRLVSALDAVIASGKNVVITAHAKMRKFEQPDEQGAYDRWEMKLSKQVAPLLKEWCDMLLFLNYKTYVVMTEMGAKKAQGGKRVIYTSHHPCWDAKNRHSLPDEMDLDFKNIAHLFKNGTESACEAGKSIDRLRSLMSEANVTDAELQKVVADKGHYAADAPIDTYSEKFISSWLIKYWPQILNLIHADRTVLD